MGTLTIATFVTLDGVIQAPGGGRGPRRRLRARRLELPLLQRDMGDMINSAFANADCFLLGRRTYEIFAARWPNFPDKDDPVASTLNVLPKYVVSTTLGKAE